MLSTEGLNVIIDSIKVFKVDRVETNLSAVDIMRENDNYVGYSSDKNGVTGTMSRADVGLLLVKTFSQATVDTDKRNIMVQTALYQYFKGNISMGHKDLSWD